VNVVPRSNPRNFSTPIPSSRWPEPRAAYIHVPFCRHRCGYCNFSVLAGHDQRSGDYLRALQAELRSLQHPRPIDTLFIGGGTPTHLSHAWLEEFLPLVCEWFPLNPEGEFSIEANPCDISSELVDLLAQHRVNRVSLGVQSFHAAHLQTLERDHRAATIERAVKLVAAKISNISIDLIFGIPGQSLEDWVDDLQHALNLPIVHLSTYGLTFEKGTRFWSRRVHGEIREVDEETDLQMYQAARRILGDAGFEHYEISNFARPSFACRHNIAYWEGRGWYAAGPGAARFVDGRREVNHRSPTTYIARLLRNESPTAESESIDRPTWVRERLVFGLRQLAGISLADLQAETGISPRDLWGEPIDRLLELGLLEEDDQRIRLSDRGLLLADSVMRELL